MNVKYVLAWCKLKKKEGEKKDRFDGLRQTDPG